MRPNVEWDVMWPQLAIQETGEAADSQGHWLAIVYAAIQVISALAGVQ